ncbi:MAG: DUF4398 domain-containing protein [candidate division FCPU426 bacterium]
MLRKKSWMAAGGAMVLAGWVAGCGSVDTRSTVEQLTNARVAVETAEQAGAATYAAEDLRQAQDAKAIALDAYANKDFERTFQFAKKATIYARVAQAKTEQKAAEAKLNAVKEQVAAVESQIAAYSQPAAILPQSAGSTPPAQAAPAAGEVKP